MGGYRYRALDESGITRSGVVEAESLEEANRAVFAMNLTTLELEAEGRWNRSVKPAEWWRRGRVRAKTEEILIFTKQLATTLRVGIPITQALETLEKQTGNPKLREVWRAIRQEVQEGSRFSKALERYPGIFTPMYISVVAAGESSGKLPEVLERLIYLIEHEAKVSADIRTALRYPFMVVGALGIAFVVMLGFVVPRFVTFFERSDIELPWTTQSCIWLSHFLLGNGWWLALGAIGAVLAWRIWMRTSSGQLVRDRMYLRIPILREVLIKAAMTRFASIFAILQSSGVMVLDSFRILTRTVGNAAVAAQFKRIGESLQEGKGIAGPLSEAKYFPPMLVNMVAVGEETGRLDEMLQNISAHYDEELRYQMKKFSDAIGPLLILSLAVVVGFFALAIYMPMWELTQMAQR